MTQAANPAPLQLDPSTTALVTIDLQRGILGLAKAPYDAAAVLANARALAEAFRAAKAAVVRVKVGFSPDLADRLQSPCDAPNPVVDALPADWLDDPAELPAQPGDIPILKRQWGAFFGTDLDLQLRRRGIRTLVLGGISTPFGVESTARAAWELGYAIVFAEDLSSAALAEQHQHPFKHVFPRLGRVRTTAEVVAALR
jgi:nicotinamidase-related amidase